MERFIWKYHTQSTEYPDGYTAKLGGGYQYAAEPRGPDQRVFKLKFPTLIYFTNSNGGINSTFKNEINLASLEAFYNAHKMWLRFIYPHPVYGDVIATFNKGLIIPEGIIGGGGAVTGFGIELLEHP